MDRIPLGKCEIAMRRADLLLIYFCNIINMSVLYAVQPIYAAFEKELGRSAGDIGLFMSVTLLPLAFGSIAYGYLIEKFSIRKMLFVVFVLLGVLQAIFALLSSYAWMLFIRAFEGFLIPMVMTGLMSYVAITSPKEQITKAIGAYIGIAIIGGFLGRFLSGFFTDIFSWRFYILLTALFCALCAILVFLKCQNISASLLKPSLKDIIKEFKERKNFFIFMMIFALFFVFQAILNYIPFEISRILGDFSGTKTSMLYFGYMFGVLICFNTARICAFFGGEVNAVIAGILVSIVSLPCFLGDSYFWLFGAMIVLCVGNFIAHSIANGFVNKHSEHKGIANGLYLCFYYLGGASGSYLPGFVYSHFGWGAFISLLALFCAFAFTSMIWLKYAYKS